MPAQMVHLAVANKITTKTNIYDHSLYYLGAISPDAIHKREGYIRADKTITHFQYKKDSCLSFLNKYLHDRNFPFYLGYTIHVLTDILWLDTVFYDFRKRYKETKSSTELLRHAYYNDLVMVDYTLYLNSIWRKEVLSQIKIANAVDVPYILDAIFTPQ